MLLRQRALLITSLGLAIISMLVFGFLFGSGGNTKIVLGVVDEDHSRTSAQVVSQLQNSNSFKVYTGLSDEEQQALKDGNRDAIIVLGPGFEQQLGQGKAHLHRDTWCIYNALDRVRRGKFHQEIRGCICAYHAREFSHDVLGWLILQCEWLT